MARSVITPLAPEVVQRLQSLGSRLRVARQRRKLRQIDLAERAGLSKSTVEALERGSAETSIGAYMRALWVMGLDREFDLVADPALDTAGATLEWDATQRRVRPRRDLNNDF